MSELQRKAGRVAKLQLCIVIGAIFLWTRGAVWAGNVATDGTLGPAQTFTGPAYRIGPGVGRLVGDNLFHSFSVFNLDQGDVATFTAPAKVHNILARVTGGSASNIGGVIATRLEADSQTPHPANFYLINSAGVLFGPGATLDIGGSFVVTTADYVKLADGVKHTALPSKSDALLTTSPPAAFGFLSAQSANLAVNGSALAVHVGKSIVAASGSMTINSAGALTAPAGQVSIVAIASPAVLPADRSTLAPGRAAGAVMGPVTLSNAAQISADGNGGGMIAIQCSDLTISGGSALHADTLGNHAGRGIAVDATGAVRLAGTDASGNRSALNAVVGAGATGHGGSVKVRAGSIEATDGAFVSTTTIGSGSGGDIKLRAGGQIVISGADAAGHDSSVAADSISAAAGSIEVRAGSLAVRGGGTIESATVGAGNGGAVSVKVSGPAVVSGVDANSVGSRIAADCESPGAGGNAGGIRFRSASLEILDGGLITSSTNGQGNGGAVSVRVSGGALLSGATATGRDSGVFANTQSTSAGGRAGKISFSAGSLQILQGATITSSTFGLGNGGDVIVNISGQTLLAGADFLASDSAIFANSLSAGAGGNAGKIRFSTGSLQILGGAKVSSSTFGSGNCGDIRIRSIGPAIVDGADAAASDSGVFAITQSESAGGRAGSIHLEAGSLLVSGGAEISSSTFGLGNGGAVTVGVSGQAILSGANAAGSDSGLFAVTRSEGAGGDAGSIRLSARTLHLLGGAKINSSSFGLGKGGSIAVSVSGPVIVAGADSQVSDSGVVAVSQSSGAGGDGGSIRIRAGSLQVLEGAKILSSSFGLGKGGDVAVKVSRQAILSGADAGLSDSGVFANGQSAGASGDAGNIRLSAGSLQVLNGATIISATSGLGNGGAVTVKVAGDALLSGSDSQGSDSGLFANTESSDAGGRAGTIQFSAKTLRMLDGAKVSSSTFGLGDGGGIDIRVAAQAIVSGADSQASDSGVFAVTQSGNAGGDAGSITFRAGSLRMLGGATISSSTFGSGKGGNVAVRVNGDAFVTGEDPQASDSGVFATTQSEGAGGDAGNISFSARGLQLLEGAQIDSSTSGLGNGGAVIVKVSGGMVLSGADSQATDSGVFANTQSEGPGGRAGNINLRTGSLRILGGAKISSSTIGLGNGGSVSVKVAGPAMVSGADSQGNDSSVLANTESEGAGGDAGSILFNAGSLQLTDGAEISSSTFGLGSGGAVIMHVAGRASLHGTDDQGKPAGVFVISVPDGASGNAGRIRLDAGSLEMRTGAEISSTTFGLGNGGDVTVNVSGRALFSGADPSALETGIFAVTGSAGAGGNGGRIQITAGRMQLLDGAQINSSTASDGAGGDVSVAVNSLLLSGGSSIASASVGRGNAGGAQIEAEQGIILKREGSITAFSASSDAGSVRVFSGGALTLRNSTISAEAGKAGGNISVGSRREIRLTDSRVTTSSGAAGGNISLSSPRFIRLSHGTIATDSSTADGGNIRIDPLELAMINGATINANGGVNGGNIAILADAKPGVVLSGPLAGRNVTATGATGASGNVAAGVFDAELAGSLVLLSTPLLSGVALEPQCGVRFSNQNVSSFILTGRGGAPPEPGSWIPALDLYDSLQRQRTAR